MKALGLIEMPGPGLHFSPGMGVGKPEWCVGQHSSPRLQGRSCNQNVGMEKPQGRPTETVQLRDPGAELVVLAEWPLTSRWATEPRTAVLGTLPRMRAGNGKVVGKLPE